MITLIAKNKEHEEIEKMSPIQYYNTVFNPTENKYFRPGFQRLFVWGDKEIFSWAESIFKARIINTKFQHWEPKLRDCKLPLYYLPKKIYNKDGKIDFDLLATETCSQERLDSPISVIVDSLQRTLSTALILGKNYKRGYSYLCMNPLAVDIEKFYDNRWSGGSSKSKKKKEEDSEETDTFTNKVFKFLTENDIQKENNNLENYFIKTSDIVNMSWEELENFEPQGEIWSTLKESDPDRYESLLYHIRQVMAECNYNANVPQTFTISHITKCSTERIVDLFLTENDLGISLSEADKLFSKIDAFIPDFRIREKFIEFLEEINDNRGFSEKWKSVSKTWKLSEKKHLGVLLHIFLFLIGKKYDVYFNELQADDIYKLKDDFNTIKNDMIDVFKVLGALYIDGETCCFFDSLIPIFYWRYLLNRPFTSKEKENISEFLYKVNALGLFRQHTQSSLNSIQDFISKNTDELIKNRFDYRLFKEWNWEDTKREDGTTTTVSFNITLENFERLIKDIGYNDRETKAMMVLIAKKIAESQNSTESRTFHWEKNFHLDHIQPQRLFKGNNSTKLLTSLGVSKKDIDYLRRNYNSIAALEILNEYLNKQKGGKLHGEWYPTLSDSDKNWINQHNISINDSSLCDITHYADFIEMRKQQIIDLLKDYFCN